MQTPPTGPPASAAMSSYSPAPSLSFSPDWQRRPSSSSSRRKRDGRASLGQSHVAAGSYDPEGLLADLSAAHEQLTFEMDTREMPAAGGGDDGLESFAAAANVASTPIMAGGAGGGGHPAIPGYPAAPARNRLAATSSNPATSSAVLFHMASSQGNSGLLSVSPRAVGPQQHLFRGVKRQRSSLSGRQHPHHQHHRIGGGEGGLWLGGAMAQDESMEGDGGGGANASDSMIMLGPRAAMRAARTAAASRGASTTASSTSDLRRMTQTKNLRTTGGGSGALDGPATPAAASPQAVPFAGRSRRLDRLLATDADADDNDDGDGIDIGDEDDVVEEVSATWGMIARMRTWRQDAILQHLYETAAFWGDKILSWTGEPNDAFWLAQTFFLTGAYGRAERILMGTLPPPRMPEAAAATTSDEDAVFERNGRGKGKAPAAGRVFAADDHDGDDAQHASPAAAATAAANDSWMSEMVRQNKGGLWDALGEAAEVDGGGQGDGAAAAPAARSVLKKGNARMVDWSMPCRYLAALSMIHQEKFIEALDLLGESNPFKYTGKNGANVPSNNGDLKIEASICRLRGVLYLRLNSLEMAKESYMEALALDVRNYDVFNELVNEMMSPEEEWDFVQSLSYNEQLHPDDAEFVRLIYTCRLSKSAHAREIGRARERLVQEYNLSNNSDVLVTAAENLFATYRYEDCHALTTKIIASHPGHPIALPLHLACLAQIPRLASSLFMLAHKLVEDEPTSPVSWYAVGLWYFMGHRWAEARRYFAATHDEDTRFGPAWITFSHCFAFEGEHEQAITAYSTTARLFPGSYFPQLCIGMEHLQLNNYELAAEALGAAHAICPTDPLLLNELGVSCYNRGEYQEAIEHYLKALQQANGMQGVASVWAGTNCNLGHAYRRLGKHSAARTYYETAICLDTLNVSAYTSLGMIAHLEGEINTAIERYHQALAISPQDAIATVLLELALPDQLELGAMRIPGIPKLLRDPHFNALDPEQARRHVDLSAQPSMQAPSDNWPKFIADEMKRAAGGRANEEAEGSTMDIED